MLCKSVMEDAAYLTLPSAVFTTFCLQILTSLTNGRSSSCLILLSLTKNLSLAMSHPTASLPKPASTIVEGSSLSVYLVCFDLTMGLIGSLL